jgi:hypothetical protein
LAHQGCETISTNTFSQIQVHRSGGQDIFLASRFPQRSQRIRADLTASSR